MTTSTTKEVDLLIIGGGPAGLSAAINGASEGLEVALIDNGSTFGGQARESSSIENYPGFPAGITGEDLMSALIAQAYKFRTDMWCPVGAAQLNSQPNSDRHIVTCDDYTVFAPRAIILSCGLTYRRLPTNRLPLYLGYGAYYGMPSNVANSPDACSYIVVGGANSAGQAAMHLAKNERATIHMVVRGRLDSKMSTYLLQRIKAKQNIHILEDSTVTEVGGDDVNRRLAWCLITDSSGKQTKIDCKCLFIFIGASPRTYWLEGAIQLDENKFIRTWNDVEPPVSYAEAQHAQRPRFPYETSLDGVFACGDVRLNSTKRVATAVGEGASALQMCHRFLNVNK